MGAAAAERRRVPGRRRPDGARRPTAVLFRRAFADGRVRTIAFAYLFAAVSYIQPISYRHTYPTIASRLAFARSFGDNKAVRLFYGQPHDLLSVGGYTAWRVGGTLAIFAAVFGMLAAVRALRAEEDAGRTELVLAGIIGRRRAYGASLGAIAAGSALLCGACFAGLVLAGLPAGASIYLALAVGSVMPVFAGVGAMASQLAPTRRMAMELSGAVVAVAFLLRVVADTSAGVEWVRWLTPLGWAEELRPFAGARPAVLLAPVAAAGLLLAGAGAVARRRDVGGALLRAHDSASPRPALLSSPEAFALRSERVSVAIWAAGLGAFAFIVGVISKSVSSAGISRNLERELEKLGAGSVLTPRGYLGLTFVTFVLALSLFACAQVGAARHQESEQQLETLLAQPLAPRRWLGGRLVLAGAAAAALSFVVALFEWLGAVSQGVDLSLARMLEAGVNGIPTALLFLGLAALAYAVLPRASSAIAYGLLVAAFLWQLFGSLLGAPRWLVDLTPFAHIGLVPAAAFRPVSAAVMTAIGALAASGAVWLFGRRDLVSA